MAKEPDQIRWVGIRPTDPSEDIPTTTKKLVPAISDLQAVKDQLARTVVVAGVDCSVEYVLSAQLVPAGETWVYTNLIIWNETSLCDMIIRASGVVGWLDFARWNSYEPFNVAMWTGMFVMKAGYRLRFVFQKGGVADTIHGVYQGYRVGVY